MGEHESIKMTLPTPPRLGLRLPPVPPPRDPGSETEEDGGLRPGDLLDGRYQIEGRLGEGGVGVVYRALQIKLHRRVAVKLLQPESDESLRPRFEREAVTLAALSHPNIVSVQDYGHTRSKPFLVMELLQGRTLRELLDAEGALAVPRALALTREVLLALAYAHDLGIVHRDLKPANLLVQALPNHEHVKVLDFGFVKLLPGSYLDRGVQLSRVGFTFGTPSYMSPEHATGGNVDGRSDLYSLGILLFEMLTGKKPFEGELSELIRDHLSAPRPRLSAVRPELAGRDDLQAIIERAMAKNREDRFEDAGAFLRAIDAISLPASEHDALAVRGAASPGSAPATSPRADPARVGDELRALGRACQHFVTASAHIVRRQAGPMLARSRVALAHGSTRLRKGSQRALLALFMHLFAFRAVARARLAHLAQRPVRLPGNPPATPTPRHAGAEGPLAGGRVAPSRAQTMVLDDPTHLDLAEVKPPPPEASGSPRLVGQG